ncbi:TetR/AcrR family transcriptional regulator [Clostridium sp. YIM B02551]|uniref:TetR/AcrR family transcriptional regulator n=1 Tax=Clostridium sp. YIM B02551 TaxID=2910679 RepID=UPI001EEA6512|nr:TetR/AcrR family transcriptional regulator [Clostridium sp. YIM B02551]
MPRTEEQNKEILDKRKEEILEAALEEFSRKGYSGTKISDIVKTAGISQGLLYHYYKSKDELYVAVIEKSTESAMMLTQFVVQHKIQGWKALVIMTESILEWLKQGGEGKSRFFFMQQAAMLEPMPEEVKAALMKSMRMNEFTANLIKQGQEEGKVVPGNPIEIATVFWSVMQGIIMNNVVMENIGLKEEIVIPEAEVILRTIRKFG